ncbi:MAG: ATP-dependent DNA helicase RecQ [Salinivirgaceae bacterium]|nr:RecQ family ATP-dependent DNA helicase [Salinivirgaceae bacterium]MDY0281501.1 ATP-dependent DNA helicase RecQ [Salinivirgaceae bacterium]
MNLYEETLKKYWGYDKFRPMQLEIVESVASGKDTLGLLPTGGGKSITFQVPAMAKPGICIVVTPLIALMKDQVSNLKKRGIKAYAIYTGISKGEIDTILNNCVFGEIKFLYISPERLTTKIFKMRVVDMNVNLIAIDEAHCISQWGYDFRPAYLKIADIRQLQPNVPILALTATATPNVVEDIQERLMFAKKNVFQKSFERKNLVYWVKESENKDQDLLRIVTRNNATGIVYVRNRKKTKLVAEFLQNNGISADFYHAGLSSELRDMKQNDWKENRTKVIVSTNAFGMGIDKPDVRYVVHLDLPDSLEAYFQEAGRGGRDEKQAHAILLYNRYDRAKLRQNLTNSFPETSFIKDVYNTVGNHYNVPIGAGKGVMFDFELGEFISKNKISAISTISALKILEMEGYLALTDEINIPTKIKFIVNRDDLYRFQVANLQFDAFIKLLLRSYTGLFQDYTPIDEYVLAKRAQCSVDTVNKYLLFLAKMKTINYIPKREKPQIIFIEERLDIKNLYISKEHYDVRKNNYKNKIEAAIRYAESTVICRSRLLLEYFGDTKAKECGQCDICKKNKQNSIHPKTFHEIQTEITTLLSAAPTRLVELVNAVNQEENYVVHVLQWLVDKQWIEKNENGEYFNKINS